MANIGLAYDRSGSYDLAVTYLRKYLYELKNEGKTNPEMESILQNALSKVAEITISTEAFCNDCRIFLDNDDKGVSPVEATVLPGTHILRVVDDTRTRVTETLRVSAGETRRYMVSQVNTKEVKVVIQMEEAGMRAPFWATTATAVASAITAGVLWGATLTTKKRFDAETDYKELERIKDRGDNLQIGASVSTGVAGAAAVAAIVLGIVRSASPKTVNKSNVALTATQRSVGFKWQF